MQYDRRRFIQVSAVGAAGLAGCMGDGGDGNGEGNATDDGTDDGTGDGSDGTTAAGRSAQEEYPNFNWGSLDDVEGPVGTDRIVMQQLDFVPMIARVPVDTAITFDNESDIRHDVVIPKIGFEEELTGGEQATVRFEETGEYDYVCTIHPPNMLGRIVVEEEVDTSEAGNLSDGDGA